MSQRKNNWKHYLKVKAERENESHDSPYCMADGCKMLNQELHIGDDLDYHRDCYQNLTKNHCRLSDTTTQSPTSSTSSSTKTRSSSAGTKDKVLFTPDCIFCNKTGKKYSYKGIKNCGKYVCLRKGEVERLYKP